MSGKSGDDDTLLYLVFGAALIYFLYKNNIFGAPAGASGSGGTVPALPPASGNYASSAGQSATAGAATASAANQGPAAVTSAALPPDFGITDPNAGWD
jgi:hypothetical protein